MLRDYLTVKTVNIVLFLWWTALDFFILTLAWGVSDANPQKYGYGIGKETYLTPSPWFFGVLFLVHVLLAGNVLYIQWTDRGQELMIRGQTLQFATLMLLNIVWATSWVRQWYIASFIVIIFITLLASNIYVSLKSSYRFDAEADIVEHILVHLPFSLFHGWTAVLLVVNGFAAFAPEPTSSKLVVKILAIWALALLAGVAVSYSIFRREGDTIGAGVILLALLAISTRQKDEYIRWTSLICGMVATFAFIKSIIGAYAARKEGQIRLDEVGGVPGVTPVPEDTV